MKLIAPTAFERLVLAKTAILDVRAPVEFAEGALPNSVNLPILNNEERAQVGTVYKQQGSEAAVALGHSLVSGAVKAGRIAAWSQFARENPEGIITCFRGGMRSALAQSWLAEAGFNLSRIEGGYKEFRNFYMRRTVELSQHPLVVISGATGAGKTLLLRSLAKAIVDLEKLARHRGSAFGAYDEKQPAQSSFENSLAAELIALNQAAPTETWFIEDESRMVGTRVVPESVFLQLRASPVVLVEEDLAVRVENTFQEYIKDASPGFVARYCEAIKNISRKLGGELTKEIFVDIASARNLDDHKIWIEKLLRLYYDPMYLRSLAKRNPKILFRGTRQEVREYLSVYKP